MPFLKRIVKEMPCQPLLPFINPLNLVLTQTNGGQIGQKRQICSDSYSSNEFLAHCELSKLNVQAQGWKGIKIFDFRMAGRSEY